MTSQPTMIAALFVWACVSSFASAGIDVIVTFQPLPEEFRKLESAIRSHIVLATHDWARHFITPQARIEVEFSIRDWPARGTGRSFVSAPFENQWHEGRHLSEEGAAQILRTGNDPNGSAADIEMFFDPAYFRTLWFDPDPAKRDAPLPDRDAHMLDAFSVILHELGHAFGFNGFRNPKTGALPGEYLSIYDRWVAFDGKNFFFNGPQATKLYGGPIPLARTNNNYHHVAEKTETTDRTLREDLMNGVTLEWSRRYHISPLDVAILTDCGLRPR
jgi:hypothetical protein